MKKFLFFASVLLCLILLSACNDHPSEVASGAISATPQLISATYTFTYDSVSVAASSEKYVAAWLDANNNEYPTYAFYTSGAGWGAIDTITTTSTGVVSSNVSISSDPSTGVIVATWTDSVTNHPTAAVYTPGSGWSSAIAISNTSTAAVNSANSFDAATGKFIATWADTNNNTYPSYAFYTPGSGWSSISTISVSSRAANVYVSYDSLNQDLMAVWVDISTGKPMSASYTSNSWGSTTVVSASADVDNDVLIASDSQGKFIVTYSDINQNLYGFYSIYTPGSGWSTVSTITTSSGVEDDVAVTYDSLSDQFLASWSDSTSGIPTYSFYAANTGWSQPATISGAQSGSDIFTCFNPTTDQFLAVWADKSNSNLLFDPTYFFFNR